PSGSGGWSLLDGATSVGTSVLSLAAACSTDQNNFTSAAKVSVVAKRIAGTNNAEFSPPADYTTKVDVAAAMAAGATVAPVQVTLPPLAGGSGDTTSGTTTTGDSGTGTTTTGDAGTTTNTSGGSDSGSGGGTGDGGSGLNSLDQSITASCMSQFGGSGVYDKMWVEQVVMDNAVNTTVFDDKDKSYGSNELVLLKIKLNNATGYKVNLNKITNYCLYLDIKTANKDNPFNRNCDNRIALVSLNVQNGANSTQTITPTATLVTCSP
ncbi:MAG: hypothetical protein RIR26_1255, partial [Pseudomonadota bacterium]